MFIFLSYSFSGIAIIGHISKQKCIFFHSLILVFYSFVFYLSDVMYSELCKSNYYSQKLPCKRKYVVVRLVHFLICYFGGIYFTKLMLECLPEDGICSQMIIPIWKVKTHTQVSHTQWLSKVDIHLPSQFTVSF